MAPGVNQDAHNAQNTKLMAAITRELVNPSTPSYMKALLSTQLATMQQNHGRLTPSLDSIRDRNEDKELRTEVIGEFKPTSAPCSYDAQIFLNSIDDVCLRYPERRVLNTLSKYLTSDYARFWYSGLTPDSKIAMSKSVAAWKSEIRLKFMEDPATLIIQADRERFYWS